MTNDESGIRNELLDAAVDMLRSHTQGGTLRIRGDSMRPMLLPGQSISVEFDPTDLTPGDVLVFRQGDDLLVHRLLGPARSRDQGPRWRTRGDGTPALDPAVDSHRVVGRVVAVKDGGVWRSTRVGRARAYARCLAWHHTFWTAAGIAAGAVDGGFAKLGVRPLFRPMVTAVDMWGLRVAHTVLFRALHPRVDPPRETTG